MPTSRTPTLGGRVQRDVRLQAALALVVGVAVVAVPLFIWGRNKKKPAGAQSTESSASASASATDSTAGAVSFGDAGTASVAVDAGGRGMTFGEPRYLRCQDPGPGKTTPDKCDHLGAIEELVTKAVAANVTSCVPAQTAQQTITFDVIVSFKKKKVNLHIAKDGTTLPVAQRKKVLTCFERALGAPNWDGVGHAHQKYAFQIPVTFQPSLGALPPGSPAVPAAANP